MIILYFLNSALLDFRYFIKPWMRSRLLLVTTCISISELIMYFFTFQLKILKEQLCAQNPEQYKIST